MRNTESLYRILILLFYLPFVFFLFWNIDLDGWPYLIYSMYSNIEGMKQVELFSVRVNDKKTIPVDDLSLKEILRPYDLAIRLDPLIKGAEKNDICAFMKKRISASRDIYAVTFVTEKQLLHSRFTKDKCIFY